ncbi:uncharacterized protein [Gossypium hirsutum]|uniref:Uncharacterized protein isoform X1 n=1 Tax=Gossypium hirsutum TaxID=3635 RepID=A0ABM2Z8R1_GOSHI|nr:uncharacterized protein LOC107920666 isoform X1 [Gossypium hirsutum]
MVPFIYVVLFLAMSGHSSANYCLCKDGVNEQTLQKTLDYACGAGADCTPINQNGPCYNPNTVKDHCNYAVNSYFQKKGQAQGSCDFSGTATVSVNPPSNIPSTCSFPSRYVHWNLPTLMKLTLGFFMFSIYHSSMAQAQHHPQGLRQLRVQGLRQLLLQGLQQHLPQGLLPQHQPQGLLPHQQRGHRQQGQAPGFLPRHPPRGQPPAQPPGLQRCLVVAPPHLVRREQPPASMIQVMLCLSSRAPATTFSSALLSHFGFWHTIGLEKVLTFMHFDIHACMYVCIYVCSDHFSSRGKKDAFLGMTSNINI